MEATITAVLYLVGIVVVLGFCWRWYLSAFSLMPGAAARAMRSGRGRTSVVGGIFSALVWVLGLALKLAVELLALILDRLLVPIGAALGRLIGQAWHRGVSTQAGRASRSRSSRNEREDFRRWRRELFGPGGR